MTSLLAVGKLCDLREARLALRQRTSTAACDSDTKRTRRSARQALQVIQKESVSASANSEIKELSIILGQLIKVSGMEPMGLGTVSRALRDSY